MEQRLKIVLSRTVHREQTVVKVGFPFNSGIKDRLVADFKATWSQTMKSWYIVEKDFNLNTFFIVFKDLAFVDYSDLKTDKLLPDIQKEKKNIPKGILPKAYLEKMEQKRYSKNSIKTYCNCMKQFRGYFENRDLETLSKDEINGFILDMIKTRNISPSHQNQLINAIKFYYEHVLGRKKEYYDIERPRRGHKLPDVLSKAEVEKMIKITKNLKHKSLISMLYSCGLRRGEAISLKPVDIESDRMLVKIRNAKGDKDRYVPLPAGVLKLLRLYYKKEKPVNWLFPGEKGNQYSETSVLNIVKKAAKRAGVSRRVYPHILRHSFATHHLEQGTDLRYIQIWLGHESSKTTEIYTHVSQSDYNKFKNPIDDMLDDS